jgi:aspartyl-tRNA(Asn)/glutamyl-tRNA(Gln) amidotransferase subunit A
VLDSALLHDVIGGHDPHDATSLDRPGRPSPRPREARRRGAQGPQVGVIRELPDSGFQAGVSASFRASLALLEAQGAEIVEVSAPHFEYGVAAYYLILPAEASSNLAKFDSVRFGLRVDVPGGTVEDVMARSRDAGFGDEVKRRIILGTYALSAGYYDAYYGSAPEGAHAHPARLRRGVRRVDVIAAVGADHRVQAGRRSTTRCRCTSTTSPRFR